MPTIDSSTERQHPDLTRSRRTVTVLGCDGSYPGPGGAASGYLVRSGETTVLVDAGPGAFANLQRLGDPAALDAVVLSHVHPDHWIDVSSLAVWLKLSRTGHLPAARIPVPVLAPPGLRSHAYDGGATDVLAWEEVEPSSVRGVGELVLRFVATDHGPPTLAVRFDPRPPGSSSTDQGPATAAFAYSADTGPDWSVEELGTGIGTVLCEATYLRDDEGRFQHLSGRQAGAMAAAAGAGRLVTTHRWPTVSEHALVDEASGAFGAPVTPAAVGLMVEW